MRFARLGLLSLVVFSIGCAGRTDPAADEIRLVLSEPAGASNVNLTRFDTANDWTRNRPGLGVTVTATQTPGPTGLSSRAARMVINNAVPGTEYSLTSSGLTYFELLETTGTGTRTWRSVAGGATLVRDDNTETHILLTNVTMEAWTGTATGTFKIAGPFVIRF